MSLGNFNSNKQSAHVVTQIITQQPIRQKKATIKVQFRIDEDLWKAYQEQCAAVGKTASEDLRQHIISSIN